MGFPDTKFMGSKQKLLPFIASKIKHLRFETALDAFSGSGCVAYMLKQAGVKVLTNDILRFAYHISHAAIENNSTRLTDEDMALLLRKNGDKPRFIRDTFKNLYFNYEDCKFLDNLWKNISVLKSPLKRSIALSAASRACMKKRPRGIFTFVGKKGWDGRKDLRQSMKDQFVQAVELLNEAVFSNRESNKAFCGDVFDIDPSGIDLVYIDTPYISPYSDCDYTRRYHFVEGYCSYWNDVEVMYNTKTKKIRSHKTIFFNKTKSFRGI